jgi:hypothetical protein
VTHQPALFEIEKHPLRDIDDDPISDDVRYDVTIVDLQWLPDFQARTRRESIACLQNTSVDAEPRSNADEGIAFLDLVGKIPADNLLE